MKKLFWIILFAAGFAGLPQAQAHPAHHLPPHCDPWLAPRPVPTPPPPGIGDFKAPEPETPPPVPVGDGVSFAYGDCGQVPTPSPSPSPTPPATPPAESPEPSDEPKHETDPGLPYLEGSGKLGCSLTVATGATPGGFFLLGLGLALPLWVRRRNF